MAKLAIGQKNSAANKASRKRNIVNEEEVEEEKKRYYLMSKNISRCKVVEYVIIKAESNTYSYGSFAVIFVCISLFFILLFRVALFSFVRNF